MACNAIKHDFSICRNWRQTDSDYCYAHRGMTYDIYTKRWFQRYILGMKDELFTFRFTPRYGDRILAMLQSGKIKLNKEHLSSIPPHPRYADVFTLLLIHEFTSPKDNSRLLIRVFQYYLGYYILWWNLGIPFKNALCSNIDKLLSSRSDCLACFIYNFPDNIACHGLTFEEIQGYHPKFMDILQKYQDTDAIKQMSWWPKIGILQEQYDKTEIGKLFSSYIKSRFLPDLKELYISEKNTQRLKMDPIKEELMMNRWHPDRIWKHLEMGIDIEDM